MEYLFQPFRFNPELLGLWPRIEERIELVPVDLQIQSVCFNSAEEHEGGGQIGSVAEVVARNLVH
jgi:hypothetical protein